jgi:hypothetical protein
MANMIDAKEAKKVLGCDDDTLNNHINSGAIRAQRVGGKLMLNQEDVQKLATGTGQLSDDDGTIVLTGESDNLQIDLGKVIEDTAETVIQPDAGKPAKTGTQTLSFSDELEVVNVDENKNTQDLAFDDSKQTMNLNFTDSNTAVMTSVDESAASVTASDATAADATSAGIDATSTQGGSPRDSHRSVRSNRARVETAPVSPVWVGVMAVSLLVMLLLVVPYFFLAMWPANGTDSAGNVKRGVDDSGWANLAGGMAGFAVEPDKDKFKKSHDGEWLDMKVVDNQATWRHKDYRKGGTIEDRQNEVYIEKVVMDESGNKPKEAIAKKEGAKYPIKEVKNGEATELEVDLGISGK